MDQGTIELTDGRRLAWATFGPQDGRPVLYCHGSPGSRREIAAAETAVRKRHPDARVIAINRPGYGPSTSRRGYGFSDWPADVEQAMDRMGVGPLAVLGVSGGAPFALACGLALPGRVPRIGIVVGSAPLEATGMATAPGITSLPRRRTTRRVLFAGVSLAARSPFGERLVARMHRELGPADRHALRRPGARRWLLHVVRDAFADGGRAATDEAGLYRRPWGFDLSAVSTETFLWYGAEDRTVPASAGHWMADRLPHGALTVWPQHGHFSWAFSDDAADVVGVMTAGLPTT